MLFINKFSLFLRINQFVLLYFMRLSLAEIILSCNT